MIVNKVWLGTLLPTLLWGAVLLALLFVTYQVQLEDVKVAIESLKKRGTIEEGVFTEIDPVTGEKRQRDATGAVMEEGYELRYGEGRKLVIPPEQYGAPILMHPKAFAYFQGVPRTILYDNTRIAVAQITGDGERKPTKGFSELQSHYLFAAKFGRPGKGNDKGNVEGLVGYARRNFMVPVPECASWKELNEHLLEKCQLRLDKRVHGEKESIGARLDRDKEKLLPLPPTPHEACDRKTPRASSQALVRYETNDYSVPVEYAHRQVLLKAFVWEVVISAGSEVIARHARSYGREEMIFDPLHYLPLLEQKTNALDQAAPLQGWPLPEIFAELRRQMEARLGKRGRREYVQVLLLMKIFPMDEVAAAAQQALQMRAIAFDAVKHLLLCAIEQRPPKLDLENYPHLPAAEVSLTRPADYQVLLTQAPTPPAGGVL